jgi:hypothetical protein
MIETMAQLVGEYNRLTGKTIKRFKSKAEGVQLVADARAVAIPPTRPRSAATKASWKVKTIAKARAVRTPVIVQGHGEFSSVAKAFNALNLPRNGRIRFRMALKAAGIRAYTHEGTTYTFQVVKKEGAA